MRGVESETGSCIGEGFFMIKLIAADVDGTLLNSHREISGETCRMIREVQRQGIRFAIASGRMYRDICILLQRYGIECECVTMNGAEYFDAQGNCLEGIYFSPEKAQEIYERLRGEKNFAVEIYTNHGCYTADSRLKTFRGLMKRARTFRPNIGTWKSIFHTLRNDHLRKMHYLSDLQELWDRDIQVAKFITFGDEVSQIKALRQKVDRIDGVAVSASFRTNIEINAAAATKGAILRKIADRAGIREDEVMVIGDGSNDLSMFQAFPTHAAAMANGVREIREAAGFITASNDEDGVARAIERALA